MRNMKKEAHCGGGVIARRPSGWSGVCPEAISSGISAQAKHKYIVGTRKRTLERGQKQDLNLEKKRRPRRKNGQ